MKNLKIDEIDEPQSLDVAHNFAVNLMQYLVVPTFVLDAEGKVIIWNKACERLTGLLAEDVIETKEHWRGFYDMPRPCLADLVVQNRLTEIDTLYVQHDETTEKAYGLHAQNWCVMPCRGDKLYLAIDAGPIFDAHGKLLAVVETLRDMTIQKEEQMLLERLAVHDGLTGIINRRGFDERLASELNRSSRDELSMALIMIDVDHFKRYNDTYGHYLGDQCLKKVAAVLSGAVLRPADMVARYGGEEFAVILPSVDEQGAQAVAERIIKGMAELALPHSGNDGYGIVTVSVGVATGIPGRGMKDADLITMADGALYQAKDAGRNRLKAVTW